MQKWLFLYVYTCISCNVILLAIMYFIDIKKKKKHFSPSDDSECWFLSGYIPTINHFERMIFARCTFHRQSTPKINDGQSAIITVVIVSRNHCILVTVRHLERFWSRRRIGLIAKGCPCEVYVVACTFWVRKNLSWFNLNHDMIIYCL